jgi:DNA polymerase
MFGVSYEEVTKAQRQIGKYGILGCGYGLGARGFVGYAKRLGGLDIDPQQAQLTVNSFRHKYPKVPQCWYTLNDMAIVATTHPGKFFNALSCVFIYSKDRDALMLRLPSGRALVYNHPRVITGEYTPYLERAGLIQTTNTWSEHIKMTPGKWCENVIQALGRDMLQHGIMTLQNHGYDVIGTIYDEVICEVPKEKAKSIDKFCKAFSMVPQWLHGCPVRAEGYVTKRYRKG